MTSSVNSAAASWFEKHYPSVSAADVAMQRSLVARMAGVPTPAVLGRDGPLRLSFERVVAGFPPTLSEMVEVLRWMKRMPPDGMIRFDPFFRIRPRLDGASPHIRALVFELEAQDASIRWSPSTVIHGDFHPGQTIRDHAGKIWLLDLDDLALAPPEADLGNLAAWVATRSEGNLNALADAALTELLALSPRADPALTGHFFQVALVRRALKLAEKGLPWAVDQLPLRD